MEYFKKIIRVNLLGKKWQAILLLLFLQMFSGVYLYASTDSPNILIFNSYHQGYRGTDDIISAFIRVVTERFPDARIKIEYLDSKYYSGREYEEKLERLLTYKFEEQHFDLIFASDDYAFNFVEKFHSQLFHNLPVVFCGTNAFDVKRIEGRKEFVGIDERPSFRETLKLVFDIRPETQKVVVIHDNSVTGQLNSQAFRLAAEHFSDTLEFSYWTEQHLEDLLKRIRNLSTHTAVFYFSSYVKTISGKVLLSSEALELLSVASPVPIFGGWEFSLGHGIIGGKLINLREHGELAGRIAADILSGQTLESMPRLSPSPNIYMFDDTLLQRFSVQDSQLPSESVIVNRPPSFYQQHKTTLLGALSAFLGVLVTCAFIALQVSRNRLQKAYQEQLLIEKNLRESQTELKRALSEIKTLQGIIPICSYCKQIRDDQGSWARLEEYFSKHSEAEFSHGICPACYEKQKAMIKKK